MVVTIIIPYRFYYKKMYQNLRVYILDNLMQKVKKKKKNTNKIKQIEKKNIWLVSRKFFFNLLCYYFQRDRSMVMDDLCTNIVYIKTYQQKFYDWMKNERI